MVVFAPLLIAVTILEQTFEGNKAGSCLPIRVLEL